MTPSTATALGVVETSPIEAITRAEVDIQVATAKRYPRDIAVCVQRATDICTRSREVAESCHYSLPRKKKDQKTGQMVPIEGASIRLAEAVASTWQNLRVAVRITEEGERFVTAQAVVHDLESNVAESREVRRRITYSDGGRYNDDMIGVTMAAAASIAKRNAVLAVVPQIEWAKVYDEVMKLLLGGKDDLGVHRRAALSWFASFGVPEDQVLASVGRRKIGDLTRQDLVTLGGYKTAIEQGTATMDEYFEIDSEAAAKAAAPSTDPPERPTEAPARTSEATASTRPVTTTSESEAPSDDKMRLWQEWCRVRSRLSEEQIAKVKDVSGVGMITRRCTEESLTTVLDVARSVEKESETGFETDLPH